MRPSLVMKTKRPRSCWRTLSAFGFFLAVPAAFGANQASTSNNSSGGKSSSHSNQAASQGQGQNARDVLKLTRADDVIGRDVMASDGKKAGDIVDLVFDVKGQPEITHVLVMTGGFLDMGGDVRAVPVSALRLKGDTCRIDMDSEQFFRAPLVTDDRAKFFSDETLVGSVRDYFHTEGSKSGESSGNSGGQAKAESGKSTAALGKPVLYSTMNGREVHGSGDRNLGTVTDAWVSLPQHRVPLIEIRPGTAIGTPFHVTNSNVRYQLPTAKLESVDTNQLNFDLAAKDIEQAPAVSSLDWASVSSDRYNSVIRLDTAEAHHRGQSERSGS